MDIQNTVESTSSGSFRILFPRPPAIRCCLAHLVSEPDLIAGSAKLVFELVACVLHNFALYICLYKFLIGAFHDSVHCIILLDI